MGFLSTFLWWKAKKPPAARIEGRPASINQVPGTERIRGRIERLQSSIARVGDGARKDQMSIELKRLKKELLKAEAAAEIDRSQ